MTYVNLASATKRGRANQVISTIGTDGFLQLWTQTAPANPDMAPNGAMLVSLPLSSVAAVASYGVTSAVITAPGTGGTNGLYALSITGDATGTYTVAGGILTAINITSAGDSYVSPPTISGFGTSGLTGATATPVMTAVLIFNAITTATAVGTGIAGWARVVTSGNIGIIDLDVGTTNDFSVVMSNTFISMGGSISCTAQVLIEA